MADDQRWKGRTFSRRQFLTLAGVGAVVGAVVLATMRKSGISSILKSTSSARTPSNPATAGKFIQTNAPPTRPSWFQQLLGGKL